MHWHCLYSSSGRTFVIKAGVERCNIENPLTPQNTISVYSLHFAADPASAFILIASGISDTFDGGFCCLLAMQQSASGAFVLRFSMLLHSNGKLRKVFKASQLATLSPTSQPTSQYVILRWRFQKQDLLAHKGVTPRPTEQSSFAGTLLFATSQSEQPCPWKCYAFCERNVQVSTLRGCFFHRIVAALLQRAGC